MAHRAVNKSEVNWLNLIRYFHSAPTLKKMYQLTKMKKNEDRDFAHFLGCDAFGPEPI